MTNNMLAKQKMKISNTLRYNNKKERKYNGRRKNF